MKKYLLLFVLLFSFYNISDSFFCDWFVEDNLCNSWSIIENIDILENFSSDYIDLYPWFFWNNFIKNFWDDWNSIGFLWTKRALLSPDFQIPVWFFSNYKNQTLSFQEKQNENNFLSYPMIKYISEDWNINIIQAGSSNNSCSILNHISGAKIEIKNNWLLDFINISWTNSFKEKVKIVKISPEYKEYFIDIKTNNFEDFSLNSWTNYSYFIVVYSDCYPNWFYSDALTIKYNLENENKNNWKILLNLTNNELNLDIPKNIKVKSRIKLKCVDFTKTIINDYLFNWKYFISNNLLKKYFLCSAWFFDFEWVFHKSENFINNKILNKYISENKALEFIRVWDTRALFEDLYLNISKVSENSDLDYSKTSLYISNILFKTYISDENITFDIFNELWFFKTGISKTDKITEMEFINLILFLEKDIVWFQNDFFIILDKNYWNKKYNFVSNEIAKVILINKKLQTLKNIDKRKYDNLYNCIKQKSCEDTSEIEKIEMEFKYFNNPKTENNFKTYNDYIKLLYFSLWYDSFKSKWYSFENYNKFINILSESISYGYGFYDKNISYNSFQNLQNEMLNYDKLRENIVFLTENYLVKINLIYESSKKEDLIEVLKLFLGDRR